MVETITTEKRHYNLNEHPHTHTVRYKTKSGSIKTYTYSYGLISKHRVHNPSRLKKVKNR